MRFDIITIFPDIFSGFLKESLIFKAQKPRRHKGSGSRPQASGKPLISIRTHYLRKWTTDRHQTVDGKPYGGGPGLVMRIEPISKAVGSIRKLKVKNETRPNGSSSGRKLKVILFSPRGKQMDQVMVKRWAKLDRLIFICGRYEGVDERVADYIADEVVSVGPYVLNGGEVAAMAAIEAVARLLPGFMHDADSQTKEDHPQYTKPPVFILKTGKSKVSAKGGSASGGKSETRPNGSSSGRKLKVPKVLLSGDHKKIAEWRKEHSAVMVPILHSKIVDPRFSKPLKAARKSGRGKNR